MNIKEIRRKNLRMLVKQVGGLVKLARILNKQPSYISRIISARRYRNVGDKFASHIESIFNKPLGWLDLLQEEDESFAKYSKPGLIPVLKMNIPLIQWSEVANFSSADNKMLHHPALAILTLTTSFSKYAFALRVRDDCMEKSSGITFPCGSFIIVEPEESLKNDSFVVVCVEEFQEPILRQFKYETSSVRYLQPLNPKYPMIEYQNNYIIYGIVRILLHDMRQFRINV